jgi:predicted amidohydrolase
MYRCGIAHSVVVSARWFKASECYASVVFSLLLIAVPTFGQQFQFPGASPDANGGARGWTTWSARPETAPHCYIDPLYYRDHPGSLAISGASNFVEHGGWEHVENGIEARRWYRFTAWYHADGVASENWQIVARLDWRSAANTRAGQPDYANLARKEGAWTRLSIDAPAPENAKAVALQLYLSNAPGGIVWWDDITLQSIPTPAPRIVKVAAVNLKPSGTKSPADSIDRFIAMIDRSIPDKTDVIVLPEGITAVGTGMSYVDVAETIPGPTTERLGRVAKARNTYIVAGIYEREGEAVYNTAILIDRSGNVAGKYRKVYLPREEIEGGLTPGSDYPVFRTDFGIVGLMICYDVMFPDPARALAGRGAQMILMPIAGGDETLARARAIENKLFVVSSGYDFPTMIIDPDGNVLSKTHKDGTLARAETDLSKRYTDPWLGDMHSRRMRELRLDIPAVQPGFLSTQ